MGRGGGVAVVFKKNKLSFKPHSFFAGNYEIVCGRAVIPSVKKSLYVFSCYYPPSMKQSEVDRMNEVVNDEIVKIKTREKLEPFFVIGGDMNQKKVECLLDNDNFKLVNTPPTRGNLCLDLCYTNCNVTSSLVQIPLWSYEGTDSDHRVISYVSEFKKKRLMYTKIRSRKFTKRGEDRFVDLVSNTNWDEMDLLPLVDDKTEWLHSTIERFKDVCFPFKTRRIRSDEDPWITEHIKKRIKSRDRIFRENGRENVWKSARDEVREKISNSKKAYYEREVEKIVNASDKKALAYTALKNINCSSRPKAWGIGDLDSNRDVMEIAEEVADYFNDVNSNYLSVRSDLIPKTFDRPTYCLTQEMVAERIRKSKKPNSAVPGDVPPKLLPRLCDILAVPACKIFNCVPSQKWPSLWKQEYQTIIPKKSRPESYADLRNLSCTNFLSKVLESFIIDSMKSEISFSELQYGGISGCGTDNFLIEMWNNVLENLEAPDQAVAIMSVDFSKAFNRLDHQACLRKLAEKNASNQTLAMIFSFLSGRKMCVKAGDKFTSMREVKGGSPQGTKLGNLLFCFAIDDIVSEHASIGEPMNRRASPSVSPDNAIPDQYQPAATSTPLSKDDSMIVNPYGFRKKIRVLNDTLPFPMLSESQYSETCTWEIGYIDDINVGEALDTREAVSTFSVNKEVKEIRAKGCEKMFDNIEKNGKDVGLKINPEKTQLICIHANNHACVSAHICVNEKRLDSGQELKILGFIFGSKPTVSYQVESLVKKFNKSIWSLFHLRKAKMNENVLTSVYTSMLRPILEYSSNVYHSMLTGNDTRRLESCQRKALRVIFGFEITYEECMKKAGLTSLADRRSELFLKFCSKMSRSERFCNKWLPKKEYGDEQMALRKRKEYIEFNAHTNRLFRSPLLEMRRMLNGNI